MTKKSKDEYTDLEWLQICQLEMESQHNDGWTIQWYKEQYEETRKKIEKENKGCDGEEGCC